MLKKLWNILGKTILFITKFLYKFIEITLQIIWKSVLVSCLLIVSIALFIFLITASIGLKESAPFQEYRDFWIQEVISTENTH